MPALIVDRFGDNLVLQVLTLGVEVRKAEIVTLLADLLQPRGIYERSDVHVRALEGLEQTKSLLWGSFAPPAEIRENGLYFGLMWRTARKPAISLTSEKIARLLAHSSVMVRCWTASAILVLLL